MVKRNSPHWWQRWLATGRVVALSVGVMVSLAPIALAEVVDVTLLHLNDIYEITPVEAGRRGGLARIAGLRRQLLARNPRTLTILAGDLFSPSALGTAIVDGKPLAGKQIVAVMNALGLDYATFGNHEFDLKEPEFLERLQESRFQWIATNVSNTSGEAFPGTLRSKVITVTGADRKPVRIGLIGLTIASNPAGYVRYEDAIAVVKRTVPQLRQQVDILIAVTHLSLEQDQLLAATFPEIDLILGGHEHENIQQWRIVDRPQRNTRCQFNGVPIFKADANGRTVYIHERRYDTERRCLVIDSRLQPITAAIPDDPATAQVVASWLERGFNGFRASGFAPEQVIATTTEDLDGLEASVRNRPTNLTRLVAQAMLREVGNADLAIFNSGSIRIDDRLPAGNITQYDVIRILPFGGKVLAVEMPGALIQKVLEQGRANRGNGGYLQTANVSYDETIGWQIGGQPLKPEQKYAVAMNDFLLSGKEQNLPYLTVNAPGVRVLATKRDIRFAVIQQLQSPGF